MTSANRSESTDGLCRLALHAMATRFELVLEGAREAGEAAFAIVEECDARYSLFRSDSLLARINREAVHRPVRVDHDAFELLSACADLRDATDGAFDVCVEPWMRARGFHEGDCAGERGTYELDARTQSVRFITPNTAIDLGGIAKGHALDRAAACLRELDVERALLHGGTSSVIALGAPPGERGWHVLLGNDADAPVAVLCDNALSISAPHGRMHGGLGHILDPRDGRSVPLESLAAVVHASARTAEAWSKALLVHAARGQRLRGARTASFLRWRGELELASPDPSLFELSPTPVR